MKRVVLTGATSFIGVHLIQQLRLRNCEIFAVVRPKSKNISRLNCIPDLRIVELDVSEIGDLSRIVGRADAFYHLAWEGTRLPYRDDEDLQKKNYNSALEAMKTALAMGCEFFLGSGSQAEYGSINGTVDESDVCLPNTPYGKEKLNAYKALTTMAKESGMRFVWTRIFSIYGRFDYSGTLIMSSIDKMRKNETINMTACTQMWDYLYVEDAASALADFLFVNCEDGVYNIASGQARQLREFVNEMKALLGSNSKINFGAIPYGPGGPVNLTPSIKKVTDALKWKPETSFSEGIASIIDNMD